MLFLDNAIYQTEEPLVPTQYTTKIVQRANQDDNDSERKHHLAC